MVVTLLHFMVSAFYSLAHAHDDCNQVANNTGKNDLTQACRKGHWSHGTNDVQVKFKYDDEQHKGDAEIGQQIQLVITKDRADCFSTQHLFS